MPMRPSFRHQPRVLVVDDDVALAETIVDGLLPHGYDGVGVTSAKAALHLLETDDIDALVTDMRMPDGDGLTLRRASMALDPSRPVIVMTAYGSIQAALDAADGGTWQYLVKPFRVDALARLLREALAARRS